VFVDGEFVVTGSVTRAVSALISLQTTFPNGLIFYTLDGATPTLASILYDSPYSLRQSVTVRAQAHRAGFLVGRGGDHIRIVMLPAYHLSAGTRGGGTVTLDPPDGVYLSNSVISVTAVPAPGWTFLQWLGDASGSSATTIVVVNRSKCLEAIFGTTL